MGKFSGRKKRYSEKSHFGNTVGGEGATAGPAKPTWAWGASPGALACACGLGQASQGLARGTGRAWARAWWLCPAVAQPPPQSWPDGLAPMGRRGNRRPPRPHRPVRPVVPTEHPQYIDF